MLLVSKYAKEQDNVAVSDNYEAETEGFENADEGEALDVDQEEFENVGLSYGNVKFSRNK